jgi:hypothetical protein
VLKSKVLLIDKIYVPVKRRQTLDSLKVRRIAQSMLQNGQEPQPWRVRRRAPRAHRGASPTGSCRSLGEQTVKGFLVQARRH